MIQIKDSNGDRIDYWPITGLVEGEVSETLTFNIPVPQEADISAAHDPRLKVMCRSGNAGIFTDISESPIPLGSMATNAAQDFEIYVEALSPITGLQRIPISVVVGLGQSAGWY